MALLEGEHLTKHFGGVVALDDVSFTVDRGETVGLIGPNGAGKSTLFKVITGALSPTSGTVRFDGQEITGKAPHTVTSLGLAKTHQIVRPFGNLTLAENVEVGAQFGREDRDPATVVAENLEFVGLADRADTYPDELSVGALKRLEIARVLATNPELVLFDEVAGGLDPEETEQIVELIREIADRGQTVFLIDHVMRALMSVSERVFVLNNGAFIAKGTPEEIQNDETVIEAYLGERARDDGDGAAVAGDA